MLANSSARSGVYAVRDRPRVPGRDLAFGERVGDMRQRFELAGQFHVRTRDALIHPARVP